MADFNNMQHQTEVDNKNKTKEFWTNVGIVAIAVVLAVLTVLVINLNG